MHKHIRTALSSAALIIGLSAGGSAAAQQAQPQTSLPKSTVPAPDYSDQQLKRFVSASQKVAMISQEYTPKLEAAASDTQKKQVFQEADDKMVKAVHDEGMTVDQFNGINQALQQDPKLLERVQEMVQQP
ncbi:DUF4168 domain-containing protein [Allopusillimonas soli]|uniref:DUF4168 domain-containing protein n=1 Tax=Allopusillimonas soli TaxID=659016 RepID=A0A853F7U3_9BURK|nr:DUF4168 domain-containing protein [Allopusillimonas soli]NYT35602.1 DUF4168 domain-containing protein [Allopusillimonas soli]TEA76004.1 DUF4168 domain-containing protein [Allopusillimonas soli]